MAADNKTIGRFILDGIPPSPRGVPQIEVSFDIDANGILNVFAKDKATGKEQKIRIEASSGLSKEDIERMKNEAEANAEADKKLKEEIEQVNAADSLVFQTEKQLKEYGDKIPAEKKGPIEEALGKLKDAVAAKNLDEIKAHTETLNTAWQAASEDLYKATQGDANAAGDAGAQGDAGSAGNSGNAADEVQDVDFEEVK